MKDLYNNTILLNGEIISGLLQSLSHETGNNIAQPHLIVGESGSGKSFLLRELASRVSAKHPNIFTVVLIDGRTLFSVEDLWQYSIGLKSRPVLLVDDMQYFFQRTDNQDQFDLRGRLSRPGAPVLICAAEHVPNQITDYKAAFFEAFKLHYIRPIQKDIVSQLVESDSELERVNRLMDYLPKTAGSLMQVCEIVNRSKNQDNDLVLLKSLISHLYSERYKNLPVSMQRILMALSGDNGGLTLAGIRDKTGQDNGKLSPYLKIMTDNGLIERTSLSQRGAVYSIADHQFRLWLSR